MVGETYFIAYVDAHNDYSERAVLIEDVLMVRGVTFVRGFCYKANAGRTFRADRILSVGSTRLPAQHTFAEVAAAYKWLPILTNPATVYASA